MQPALLEGALAQILSGAPYHDFVHVDEPGAHDVDGVYDAAVVSDVVPQGIRAEVVITLPDTRGSGGTGTVRRGDVVHEASIASAERVVELLESYLPRS